jgi:curved DNA-binding protein CbpA
MTSRHEDIERLRTWTEVLEDSNYYEILGVLELADASAIKAAFHEFALAFHPDLYEHCTEAERAAARYVFRRGAEAYRVLGDPELRSKYDLAVASGHLRLLGGEPAQRVTEGALKSLEDLCKSPAARLAARRADQLIGRGDLLEARKALKDALAQEGYENPDLEERIEALDLALFAMGS